MLRQSCFRRPSHRSTGSHTLPRQLRKCQTFIVAGAGELPEGSTNPDDILLCGDVSSAALAEKASYVMTRMQDRLHAMGVSWPQVTAIDVYTARDLSGALLTEILKRASHNTLIWNYARPPIKDLEFEMDLRGVRCEIVLNADQTSTLGSKTRST